VEEVGRNAPRVSDAHRVEGERIAGRIDDSELRELVSRAAAASLARGRDDRPLW
jgi:hypothetical protein